METGSFCWYRRLCAHNFFILILWVGLSYWQVEGTLVPAFQMDGGRVLRATLAMHMNHNRTTPLAAKIGQGLAL